MFNLKKLTPLLMTAIFIFAIACQGKKEEKKPETYGYPESEMPVSTSSDEAMKTFVDGLAMFDQNKAQIARKHFDQALELDPNFVSAGLYRMFCSNSAEDFANNRDAFLSMRAMANTGEAIWMDMVEADMAGDDVKFFELSKKLSATYPNSARAMDNLAGAYNGRDEVDQARAHWKKANELNPDFLPAVSNLGASYLFNSPKDFQKAETYLAQVAEKMPNSSRAQIDLGDCYRAQKDLEKALASYEKATQLDPNDEIAFSKAGHANSFLGNYDAARKNYQDSRAVSEFGTGSINFEAYTYLYEGDYKKACSFFHEHAERVDGLNIPDSNKNGTKMMCTFNCAMIAMHHGDTEHLKGVVEAMKPLSEQQGQTVGTDAAIRNQNANMHYWEVIAAASEDDFDTAMAKAEALKGLLSEMNDVNNMRRYDRAMAYINWKQKNYDAALAHAEKLNNDNVYDRYWMAHANKAVGNEDKAMEIFNEIVDNNFNSVGYALILNELKETTGGTE